jgi:hypothetical protein
VGTEHGAQGWNSPATIKMKRIKLTLLAIGLSLIPAIVRADGDPNDPYNPEDPFRLPGIVTVHSDGTFDRDGTILGEVHVEPVTGDKTFAPRSH